ncbi:MAG: hypothetical protein RLZZ455_408 [Candidatus Parcubacteria bacterium]
MIKRIIQGIFILLLLYLSFFPRATEVIAQNYIFGFDQGRDYLAARSIIEDHKFTLIGSEWGAGSAGLTGLFHGPGYFYLLSIAYLLFDGNPYGGVVFMLLLGLISIVMAYVIGKKILGSLGGYFFAFLIAISPPLIAQSRFFWNSYPSTPLILGVFYFVYRSTLGRKNIDIFLSSFLSGFIYNFQTGIAVPLILTYIIYAVLFLRLRKFIQYVSLFSGVFLSFLPLIFFELRHNFQGARGLISYLFVHEKTEITLLFLQRMMSDHLGSFIYNFSDSFPKTNIPWWILLITVFISSLYFWYKEKNGALRIFLLYLLTIPFVAFLVFSPLRNSVYPYYLYSLTLVYLFFFSYSFSHAVLKRSPFVLAVYVILFVWFSLVAVVSASTTYSADVRDYGGDAKFKGKLDAITFIYTDAGGKNFNLLVFSPPVYTYPYDYLLQWYGKKKFGYLPGAEKEGVVYLLIEKDHSKPWSYKGWLETVIVEGKVEKTSVLPSGLIVQKRVFPQ